MDGSAFLEPGLRDLRGKPTGVRTLGLVGVGSALAVLSPAHGTSADQSRVIPGLVTGVGFPGAGVIVRSHRAEGIQGLTTAACVWLTSCMSAACAIARWPIVVVAALLVLLILLFGGPLENAIHTRWRQIPDGEAD